jgi:hypothetical protein
MIHYFFLGKTARKRAVVPVIRLVSPHKDISGLSNGIIDSNLQRPDIIKKCRQQKNNIDRGTKRSCTQKSVSDASLHAPKQKGTSFCGEGIVLNSNAEHSARPFPERAAMRLSAHQTG